MFLDIPPICAYLRLRVLFLFAGALPLPAREVVLLRPVVLRVVLRPVVLRAVVFFRPVLLPAVVFLRPVVLRAVVFFRPAEVVFLRPPPRVVFFRPPPLVPLDAGIGAGGGGVPGVGDGQLEAGSCSDPDHVSPRLPCSIRTSTNLCVETWHTAFLASWQPVG